VEAIIKLRARKVPRGFTLTELLVVMVIIISLLSVGTIALSSLISRSVLREAQATVVATLRLARQFAITNNAPCIVEVLAIDDNPVARKTTPGTPYRSEKEGAADQVRVTPLRALRDVRTGAAIYALTATSVRNYTLPEHIVFDDLESRGYPDNAPLRTDYDDDSLPDPQTSEKIYFQFNADGSCPIRGDVEQARSNILRMRDVNSGETATIVVLPGTGYVKAR
jgi:prepilin-type N-terminal cleavage/methylation domain-containing protein